MSSTSIIKSTSSSTSCSHIVGSRRRQLHAASCLIGLALLWSLTSSADASLGLIRAHHQHTGPEQAVGNQNGPQTSANGAATSSFRHSDQLGKASLPQDGQPIGEPDGAGSSLSRSTGELSSAELTAEFRDADSPADSNNNNKEQSRLAKLCQQTSSVLAAVLPAPFGGQKRSILCQFFGQISMPGSAARKQRAGAAKQQPAGSEQARPIEQQLQQPASSDTFAVFPVEQPQLLATFPGLGLHPIQLVLEQHSRQQHQLMQHQRRQQVSPAGQQQQQQQQQPADLSSSGSVLDFAYKQRLEPPASFGKPSGKAATSGAKYSSPVSPTSFKPVSVHHVASQQMSSTGWRIFNQSLGEQPAATTPVSQAAATSQAASSSPAPPSGSQASLSTARPVQLEMTKLKLVAGKQSLPAKSSPTEPAKVVSNSTISTGHQTTQAPRASSAQPVGANATAVKNPKAPAAPEVRTIEVMAQSSNITSLVATFDPQGPKNTTLDSDRSSGGKPAELQQQPQVQKREELVIASINNLTRIAFGNQLRDTVKVISRLIDQQAGLFGGGQVATSKLDHMLAADSSLIGKKVESPHQQQQLKIAENQQVGLASKASAPKKPLGGSQPGSKGPLASSRKPSPVTQLAKLTTKRPRQQHQDLESRPVQQKSATTPRRELSSAPLKTTRAISNHHHHHNHHEDSSSEIPERRLSDSLHWAKSNKPSPKGQANSFEDLLSATTISDLWRDKQPAAWQPTWQAHVAKAGNSNGILETASQRGKLGKQSAASTNFPWLVMNDSSKFVDKNDSPDRWTTSKETTLAAPASGRQALIFNRLDYRPDTMATGGSLDSLSRLKMSLTTSQPLIISSRASSSSSSSANSEAVPQSRWVATATAAPSVLVASQTAANDLGSSNSSASTSSTTTTTTRNNQRQSSSSQPASSLAPSESAPATRFASTTPTIASTQAPNLSQNDLNELRASDSISRYTTHLSESVNERLLLTTRRAQSHSSLPQTATTGEYFDAETIASWPERYQTMLSKHESRTTPLLGSSVAATGGLSVETTRRNGESYESSDQTERPTTPQSGTMTRSRLPATTISMAFGSPAYTILPANHKLTTPGAQDAFPTTLALPPSPLVASHSMVGDTRQTSAPALASYTLIGPYSGSDSPLDDTSDEAGELNVATTLTESFASTVGQQFPQVLVDLNSSNNNNNNGNKNNSRRLKATINAPLMPPYLEPQDLGEQETDEDSELEASNFQTVDELNISRKLYELLVPSSRNFVGAQNPLNQQRFNLSALKYLGQNVVSGNGKNNKNNTSSANGNNNSTTTKTDKQATDSSEVSLGHASEHQTLVDNQRPTGGYYDWLLNDYQTTSARKNRSSSISSKIATVLSDLRHLEQRKAAALLAAIRYQVPGPLIRPWDFVSDHQTQDHGSQRNYQSQDLSHSQQHQVAPAAASKRSDGPAQRYVYLDTPTSFGRQARKPGPIDSKQTFVSPSELADRLNRAKWVARSR